MKRLHTLIILFFTCFLFSMCNRPSKVLIFCDKNCEGKILIFFNQKGYKPLIPFYGGYYAHIDRTGILRTSSSLVDIDSATFFFGRVDSLIRSVQDTGSSNYADWYSGKHTGNLSRYKNEDFYVAYYYNGLQHSSKDSLLKFLREIGGDTIFITPSVIKHYK